MILLKVAVLSLLLSCASAARNETKLVKEVCKESQLRYDDCVEALYDDFRTNSITDLRALTYLSIDLASANSSEVVGYVEGLLEHSPAAQKPVIASCLGSLKTSRGNFRTAIGDLMEDVMTANYDCFVAMDGVTACQEAMKSAKVSIPGISTRCGYVEFFSRLCYAATNMLGKEQNH